MDSRELLQKPLWLMTGEEFIALSRQCVKPFQQDVVEDAIPQEPQKRFVKGIDGIAEIFGCSRSTANRIKKSGRINGAITQLCRTFIVDVDKAIELASRKPSGRGRR